MYDNIIVNFFIELLKFFNNSASFSFFFRENELQFLNKLENLKLNKYEDNYLNIESKIVYLDNYLKRLYNMEKKNYKLIYQTEIDLHKNIKLYKKLFYKYKNLYLYIAKKRYIFLRNEKLLIYKKKLYKLFFCLLKRPGFFRKLLNIIKKNNINYYKNFLLKKKIKSKCCYKNIFLNFWKKSNYPKILKKKYKNFKKSEKLETYETFLYFESKVVSNNWWLLKYDLNKKKYKFVKFHNRYTLFGYFFEFFYTSFYYYFKNHKLINKLNNLD